MENDDRSYDCPTCKGAGTMIGLVVINDKLRREQVVDCAHCRGTGKILAVPDTSEWEISHARLLATWWFKLTDRKLEYSEKAAADNGGYYDREIFKEPFSGFTTTEWVKGRVFECKGKYYIVVNLSRWGLDFSAITTHVVDDLCRQIQCEFKLGKIFDVIDEEGRPLSKSKKKE